MFDDKAAQKMYEYIDDTVKSMLEASRKIDAVDLRLIFGWLAFGHPEVTAWLRGQVSLSTTRPTEVPPTDPRTALKATVPSLARR